MTSSRTRVLDQGELRGGESPIISVREAGDAGAPGGSGADLATGAAGGLGAQGAQSLDRFPSDHLLRQVDRP